MEWHFWYTDFGMDEPDTIVVRRMVGTGSAGPILATYVLPAGSSMQFASPASWASPQPIPLWVTYTPEDPRTPAIEERLLVEYYNGSTMVSAGPAATGGAFGTLRNELDPGDPLSVGFVSGTGGYDFDIRLRLDTTLSGFRARNSEIALNNVCP